MTLTLDEYTCRCCKGQDDTVVEVYRCPRCYVAFAMCDECAEDPDKGLKLDEEFAKHLSRCV